MASEKITNFIEELKTLSVLELKELIDTIQEEFGVTAVMTAGPAAATESADAEKTEFDVVLTGFENKMGVIKVVKEILGLGLKESKEFVEGAPKTVKEGVSKEEAEEIKTKLEAASATVEIK